MLLNYETCVVGEKCILVPYRKEHVDQYHEWMQSPFLLEATGSEPLSLEEEIQMQQSWKNDEDKCTFIILAKDLCNLDSFPVESVNCEENKNDFSNSLSVDSTFISKNLDAMIGDVNLFLSDDDDDDDDDDGHNENENGENQEKTIRKQAELDVMIAEVDHRGKGIGKEASCMMMLYAAEKLQISKFIVKVNEDNHASRHLFEKTLHFRETNYAACFKQYEYKFQHDSVASTVSDIRKVYMHGLQSWQIPSVKI